MPAPGFLSDVVLWPWYLPAGEDRTITITFDENPGTLTVDAGPAYTIPATIAGSGTTRTITWSAEQAVAIGDDGILGGKWRLRINGVTKMGGPIRASSPTLTPTAAEWTVQLPDVDGGNLTVTIAGGTGMRAAATYRIPMVAGWNPSSLVPGIYAAGRVFLFGCAVADIAPAPSEPFEVIVEAAFADGTPSDPAVEDIPGEDAWFTVQDLEDADIYGALLIPLDYLVAPYEEYLPPEFEGSYPFGQPIWYRGRSVDADGFRTAFHMFMPDGIPADPEAFPMIVFADGHKTSFTVAAPADDTTAGDPSEVTVDYEAVGTGLPPTARNVDARMAALEARLAALE